MNTLGKWLLIGVVWLIRWIGFVAVIVLTGAVLGLLLGPVFGWLSGSEGTAWQASLKGASVGARYFGVWAGGLALILCFMYGHKLNRRAREGNATMR